MPRPPLPYRLALATIRLGLRLTLRLTVEGEAHLPASGPLLVVGNHINALDPFAIFACSPRHPFVPLAKAELRHSPLAPLIPILGGIYVKRGQPDRAALRAILAEWAAGHAVGIAPEGTRSGDGVLQPGQPGVAWLALQANVPIVPAAMWGHERASADWRRLRRPRAYLRYGPPFRLAPDPAQPRKAQIAAGTTQIMSAIAALLPPAYRGSYAEGGVPQSPTPSDS